MQVGVPTWIDTSEQGKKMAALNGVDDLDEWRPNWYQPKEELTSFTVRLGTRVCARTHMHALVHGMCARDRPSSQMRYSVETVEAQSRTAHTQTQTNAVRRSAANTARAAKTASTSPA